MLTKMKNFLGSINAKNSRRLTLLLCVICVGSLIAAFIVGISGNISGLALCYIAAISFILAFVHTWRKVKNFLILLGASFIGFFLFVVLHNLFYALGEMASGIVVLGPVLGFFEVVFFLLAILVCPPGFLIGAVGSVVMAVIHFKRERISEESPPYEEGG